jgi:hypothetical protein
MSSVMRLLACRNSSGANLRINYCRNQPPRLAGSQQLHLGGVHLTCEIAHNGPHYVVRDGAIEAQYKIGNRWCVSPGCHFQNQIRDCIRVAVR